MKKIGILTYFTDIPYFNDINPGMDLQAYGVYSALKDQYPDAQVEFIRYHSWFAIWRIYISGITVKSFIMDCKQFIKYYRFIKQFPLSSKVLVSLDYEKSNKFIDSLNYDAIYVGSDTLLELFRTDNKNITAYWLSPKVRAKKFMMAASARDTSYSKTTNEQREKLTSSIRSFDALGIRDDATYNLIKNFVDSEDKRLEIIPDPTFYFDIDYREADLYAQKKGIANCKHPIVCFHLLKTDSFGEKLADLYHKRGYLIASLRPAKYADFLLKDLSPMEFAGIFKYFKLTITHRFHDSVFNIKNLTPILLYLPSASYKSENGFSKQKSLTSSFGIEDTNFVDSLSSFTPDEIMKKADIAIEAFNNRRNDIQFILKEYKSKIKDYVKKTSQL